jgi:RNA polymerase sigma-70 factor, ECF subfamily
MEAPFDNEIRRAVGGDREALASLLGRCGPLVRNSLAGRIPKRWQSVLSEDDVMQQSYADALVHVVEFESDNERAFASWLEKIARRNLSDAIRSLEAEKRGGDRRRVEAPAGHESFVALYKRIGSTKTTPSGEVAGKEARAALERAITHLPEVYARVVRMYDLEGRPVQEVATALGRSPGAVFMLRARALDRLHEIMGRTSNFYSGSA